jgi:hypothetical protein
LIDTPRDSARFSADTSRLDDLAFIISLQFIFSSSANLLRATEESGMVVDAMDWRSLLLAPAIRGRNQVECVNRFSEEQMM